ncbi:glucokinase regulatory protein-like [Mustela putorius furo]|uniref:Glucokinase regulatory protein-like n=1 Tax=Mustela putorius furo TaxID=9669 RepID=A0A8U0SJL0_MUSPF|nr:glucokinase regulatory protein-like [Mustela putorius furo]XP_044943974.1 glucokinase regulatory protein-like [Mustela putorius furo]
MQASISLEEKGRVYLVGWQTLGIMAIMDGVECIHSFGADYRDIHSFLTGDQSDMFNQRTELIHGEIGTVVFIFTLDDNLKEVQALLEQVKEKMAHIQAVAHSTVGQTLPTPLRKLFPPSSASRGHCFSSNRKGTSSRLQRSINSKRSRNSQVRKILSLILQLKATDKSTVGLL